MKFFSHQFSDNNLFYHRFLLCIISTLTILRVPLNHNIAVVANPLKATNYTAAVSKFTTCDPTRENQPNCPKNQF